MEPGNCVPIMLPEFLFILFSWQWESSTAIAKVDRLLKWSRKRPNESSSENAEFEHCQSGITNSKQIHHTIASFNTSASGTRRAVGRAAGGSVSCSIILLHLTQLCPEGQSHCRARQRHWVPLKRTKTGELMFPDSSQILLNCFYTDGCNHFSLVYDCNI